MRFLHADRLPKITREQEEQRRKELENEKITLSDRLLMIGTAFLNLFLPAVAILIAFVLLVMWIFGLL